MLLDVNLIFNYLCNSDIFINRLTLQIMNFVLTIFKIKGHIINTI